MARENIAQSAKACVRVAQMVKHAGADDLVEGLAKLPDAPVYLFEGPRKAAKAAPCFPNAVCIAFWGGAHASKQTDFSPLRGRASALWRDADEAGTHWKAATIAELQSVGAVSIRFVDPERMPADMLARIPENKRHKFDVVDLIEAGISPHAIGEAAERACMPVALSSAKAGPTPLSGPETASEPYPIDALGAVLAPAAHAIATKVR